MPDAPAFMQAVFVTVLRGGTGHLWHFIFCHTHYPFDFDFFFLGLPPSLPFALAAAALASLVTAPAWAARQAGQINATL
jgi:hypothetical protein